MRLQQLKVNGFRSCQDLTVPFQDDLTVLVGENGSGKSNIVDALRLVTSPASGRRSLYFDPDRDLSYGAPQGTVVTIQSRFTELTELESSLYLPQLVDRHGDLVYTTTFATDPSVPKRLGVNRSVGDAAIADPEPENRERISYVYLPPLRDAVRSLDSGEGNRLAEVMKSLGSVEEIQEFEQAANNSLRQFTSQPLATKSLSAIQEHLVEMTQPAREQVAGIGFRDQSLSRLARVLYMQMAEMGSSPRDLISSGLGYANLLYIATVVIELEKAKEFDLTVLLVEEPEAHLHPQLQSVLLAYLESRARLSAIADPNQSPSGRIQVVVSSHSPNLASAVSTNKIVIVSKEILATGGVGTPNSAEIVQTRAVALSGRGLPEVERRKLDRYLSVTRASLLFARQVVLVEGIAESLLVRVLAEQCVLRVTDPPDPILRLQREQYRAITIVAIDGVDFLPYLRLLLGDNKPIVERLVVITDADPTKDGKCLGAERKAKYQQDFANAVSKGVLSVHVGLATLEADLLSEATNEPILRKCFLELHSRSEEAWDSVCRNAPNEKVERALYFLKQIKSGQIALEKGDFAHLLADSLSDPVTAQSFSVPPYLHTAILGALMPVVVEDEASKETSNG